MRILLINPHTKARDGLQKFLEEHCYTVDVAPDCLKGSYFARINRYDLILIGHAAPPVGASVFCQELRAANLPYPILVLLPDHDPVAGTACLDAGADDFTKPPITNSELAARIRCLLRRPLMIRKEEIVVGSLRIDRRSQTVRCRRKEIYLTRKEFAALEILAINSGEVVTYGEMIEHIWGSSADFFSPGALKTHVYVLRKKLGKGCSIRTVIERGYRLE